MKLFLSSLGIRVAVRGMATMVLIAGVLIAAGATPTAVRAATTITVNSASDAAANDGHCTLREAITSANTNTASGASGGECPAGALGADNIVFNIGGGRGANDHPGIAAAYAIVIDLH